MAGGDAIGNTGNFHAPTVVADAHAGLMAMNDEPFGPLALVARMGSIDEALAEANRMPVGLASFAFTSNVHTAARITRTIRAGMLGINTSPWACPKHPSAGSSTAASDRKAGSRDSRPTPRPCSSRPWSDTGHRKAGRPPGQGGPSHGRSSGLSAGLLDLDLAIERGPRHAEIARRQRHVAAIIAKGRLDLRRLRLRSCRQVLARDLLDDIVGQMLQPICLPSARATACLRVLRSSRRLPGQ